MVHQLSYRAALLLVACGASAAPPAPDVVALFSKGLHDIEGKEVLMMTVEYPPGGADPIHRHDAHAFVYVLEGSIVMQVEGSAEITLTPGQTFYEAPHDIHTIGRNASVTQPAKFLVVLVKNTGTDAMLPVELGAAAPINPTSPVSTSQIPDRP